MPLAHACIGKKLLITINNPTIVRDFHYFHDFQVLSHALFWLMFRLLHSNMQQNIPMHLIKNCYFFLNKIDHEHIIITMKAIIFYKIFWLYHQLL